MEELGIEVMARPVVAQVEPEDLEVARVQVLRGRQHVLRLGAALPAVHEEYQVPRAARQRAVVPGEPHTVAAVDGHRAARREERRGAATDERTAQRGARQHRLQVRIRQPERRPEGDGIHARAQLRDRRPLPGRVSTKRAPRTFAGVTDPAATPPASSRATIPSEA